MNRLVIAIALVLCSPIAARGDEASRHAEAEEAVVVLRLQQVTTQVMDSILQQAATMTTQRAGGALTPEAGAALKDFQKSLAAMVEPQLGWKAMEPGFADLYAKMFTEEQLDAIITFYKSPAGVALLEKMPQINQQANQLLQARMAALQPQMKKMFDDYTAGHLPKPPVVTATPVPASGPAQSTGQSPK